MSRQIFVVIFSILLSGKSDTESVSYLKIYEPGLKKELKRKYALCCVFPKPYCCCYPDRMGGSSALSNLCFLGICMKKIIEWLELEENLKII